MNMVLGGRHWDFHNNRHDRKHIIPEWIRVKIIVNVIAHDSWVSNLEQTSVINGHHCHLLLRFTHAPSEDGKHQDEYFTMPRGVRRNHAQIYRCGVGHRMVGAGKAD